MQMLNFLISTLIGLYTMVLLLRIWMQWSRTDFYNPLSQLVVKATNPLVIPLRRVIPSLGQIDTATLLIAFVVCLVKAIILLQTITFVPTVWIIALLILLKTAGQLFFWVMILRSIMSWVSQGRNPIEYALIQLTEPVMAPVRRILPPMAGIDFSGMVLILVLYALNIGVAEVLALSGDMLLPSVWYAI